jgi:hypothetical protein
VGEIAKRTDELIAALGDLNEHGKALAAAAMALAADADNPPTTEKGGTAPRSPIVNAWRATTAELVEKGRVRDEGEDDLDDWASAAAGAGATPIRHTA